MISYLQICLVSTSKARLVLYDILKIFLRKFCDFGTDSTANNLRPTAFCFNECEKCVVAILQSHKYPSTKLNTQPPTQSAVRIPLIQLMLSGIRVLEFGISLRPSYSTCIPPRLGLLLAGVEKAQSPRDSTQNDLPAVAVLTMPGAA